MGWGVSHEDMGSEKKKEEREKRKKERHRGEGKHGRRKGTKKWMGNNRAKEKKKKTKKISPAGGIEPPAAVRLSFERRRCCNKLLGMNSSRPTLLG